MTNRTTRSNSQSMNFSLVDIENLILSSENRLTEHLDALKIEIQVLHNKVREQQQEIDTLKSCLVDAEKRRLADDRRARARNLVIRGLEEQDEEDSDDLIKSVRDVFRAVDVDDEEIQIKDVERIGKSTGTQYRLVKVVLSNVSQRNALLEKARLLRGKTNYNSIYFDCDRSFWDRKENARIRHRAKVLRAQNPEKSVRIHRGRLLLDGSEVDREDPLRLIFPSN